MSEIVVQVTTPAPIEVLAESTSAWRGALRRFVRHRAALVGLVVLVAVTLAAVLAPLLVQNPNFSDLIAARTGPSAAHLLGTDTIGRDVLARVVYGARVSLTVSILAVAFLLVVGSALGAVAGYIGGAVDAVVMRLADVVMAFPTLLIVLAFVAITGPSMQNIIVAIGLTGWPAIARLVRSSFLTLREEDYVKAAKALGASPVRIMFRHIFPVATGPLMVAGTFGMAQAILMEAGLSFLGVGVQPPTASWGNMLTEAQSLTVLRTMPWLWLPPGLAIAVVVLCINFVGDGLRDALDPRSEA